VVRKPKSAGADARSDCLKCVRNGLAGGVDDVTFKAAEVVELLVTVLNWLGFLEAIIRPFLGASERGRKAGAKDNVVQRNVNDVSNPAQKPRTDDTIEDYEITSSDKRAAGERYRVYHDLVLRVRFDQIGRDQAFLYKNPRNRQSVEGQRETGSPSPAHQRPYLGGPDRISISAALWSGPENRRAM